MVNIEHGEQWNRLKYLSRQVLQGKGGLAPVMLEMMVAVLDEGPEKGFAPIVRAYSGKKHIYTCHTIWYVFPFLQLSEVALKKIYIDFGVMNADFHNYDNSHKRLSELTVSPS